MPYFRYTTSVIGGSFIVPNTEGVGVSKVFTPQETDGSILRPTENVSVRETGDMVANLREVDGSLAWYCARTKPKHEHIAAANVRQNLGLEVFHPRLRMERATQRGVMRVVEPLFPCYIFIRCVL